MQQATPILHLYSFLSTGGCSPPNTLTLHVKLNKNLQIFGMLASKAVHYVMRQRHGTKVTPPPVTCVMPMISNKVIYV
jgi:hypothetical protein